jgi:hypothetical protein
MMDDRAQRRLTSGVEALAAQVLGRPARVLWLEGEETAAAAVDRYLEQNPEARGRLELLAIGLPPAQPPVGRELVAAEVSELEHALRPGGQDRIRELRRRGMSHREISEATGTRKTTVQRRLLKAGTTLALACAIFLGAVSVRGANAYQKGVIVGGSDWKGKAEIVLVVKNVCVPQTTISDWIGSGRDGYLSNTLRRNSELIDPIERRWFEARSQISGTYWQVLPIDNKNSVSDDGSRCLSVVLNGQDKPGVVGGASVWIAGISATSGNVRPFDFSRMTDQIPSRPPERRSEECKEDCRHDGNGTVMLLRESAQAVDIDHERGMTFVLLFGAGLLAFLGYAGLVRR